MTSSEIEQLRVAATNIARDAGDLIMGFTQGERSIVYKGERDMVTQVDAAAEELIIKAINKQFPDHSILAEEGGDIGASDFEYRWIIDPLDGTTNFVHGFPVFGVSIGVEYAGEMVAGAIYDPNQQEMFSAGAGLGATMNDKPIHVSKTEDMGKSLIATGFPYTNNAHFELNMKLWQEIYGQTQGLRRAGAAAIDLAYVACGRLDAYWEFCIKPWDMAAGLLIAREAGGVVSDPYGEPLKFSEGHILAANPKLYPHLLELISQFDLPRKSD